MAALLERMLEGFMLVRRDRRLIGTLVVTVIYNTFGWPFTSMIPVIGQDNRRGRRVMHVEAGMSVEPPTDRGMLMGGVIVGDDVDVETGRGLVIAAGPRKAAVS